MLNLENYPSINAHVKTHVHTYITIQRSQLKALYKEVASFPYTKQSSSTVNTNTNTQKRANPFLEIQTKHEESPRLQDWTQIRQDLQMDPIQKNSNDEASMPDPDHKPDRRNPLISTVSKPWSQETV